MDGSHVDTLARAIAQRGTRRWLVRLVATLPLGGALTTRSADEAAAERPIDRLQRRTPQRNRQQRNTRKHNNNQNNNQNNNNGGGGGGGNGGQGGTCDCPGDLTCLPNGACGRVCADGSGCAGCTPMGSVCPPPARSGPSLSFCLWPDQTCDNTIACNPNERSFCSQGLACLQTACAPSAYRCVQVADCP